MMRVVSVRMHVYTKAIAGYVVVAVVVVVAFFVLHFVFILLNALSLRLAIGVFGGEENNNNTCTSHRSLAHSSLHTHTHTHTGACCTSAVVSQSGACCSPTKSGSKPTLDRHGRCCASGLLDPCSNCVTSVTTSTVRDPTGACCEKILLDGAGRCCRAGGVDVCGVCGGRNSTCRLKLSLELDWAALGLETDEEVRECVNCFLFLFFCLVWFGLIRFFFACARWCWFVHFVSCI